MGPHSHAVDLPDPWDTSTGDTLPGISGNENNDDDDELISRLAGDDVERLMGGKPLPLSPRAGGAGPVQELASQLDNFFAELRQKQTETIQDLARQEQNNGGLVIDEAEREALMGDLHIDEPPSPSDLQPTPAISAHRLFIDADPAPAWYARPLNWCGGVIESLSPAARVFVSLTAIVSFLAACAALVYVLILRQG